MLQSYGPQSHPAYRVDRWAGKSILGVAGKQLKGITKLTDQLDLRLL